VAAVSGVKGMATGHKYDPADYRDELEHMVCLGLTTREFIERSQPSLKWFRQHVLPICTLSKCTCGKFFSPRDTGMLLECTYPRCPVALSK
jgi:hypothetical protein